MENSPTAAPPSKKVRVSEIEIQTSETIETLEKKEKDQSELCAKLQEYRAIARERDEWKKKYEDLQVAYKEDVIGSHISHHCPSHRSSSRRREENVEVE